MKSDVELRGGTDLRRISTALRRMDDKELKKRFSKELRAAAKPLVPLVRASIRAIPSSRPYSAGGLRGRMSKAVRLEVKTAGKQAGVVIRVDGRKMPSRQKAVPAFEEGTKKRWQHPVFGNRNVWVKQSAQPYFYKAVKPAGIVARKAVNKVIDGVTKDIT